MERPIEEACLEEGAQLSLNLTGGVYVNQTAAFSDFHGSGGNPAANAALCDGAFVASRFRVVEVRSARRSRRAPRPRGGSRRHAAWARTHAVAIAGMAGRARPR